MEVVFVIAGIAVVLLLAELLLPTGGLLAFIGGVGLVASGIVALNGDSTDSSAIGAALITAGVISVVSFAIVGRKVLRAQRDQPANTGAEALIGKQVDVREGLNPVGQVFAEGALWRARPAEDGATISAGTRVRVESVDGFTLVVSPPAEPSKQEES
jgi:membrane protein implicated in regulation of membrane protease activity